MRLWKEYINQESVYGITKRNVHINENVIVDIQITETNDRYLDLITQNKEL